MFNARVFENSRPDGIGALEAIGAGGEAIFVPLKRSELRGEVVGPLASLQLTQVFGYTRAQCDRVLEAVYRFPLPGDAAVTGVRVKFGSVAIRASLAERQDAEKTYETAKKEGRQAVLATRESPDVFTLQVAGIHPDEEVSVETTYVQLARAQGRGWTLRIPLTTAPRYVRADEVASRHAQGQPLCLLRDPGHRFLLDLGLRGSPHVESPTHPLEVSADLDRARVRLAAGEVVPDRDCVLSWTPAQAQDRASLEVFSSEDPSTGDLYFLALVAPPARRPERCVPREAILLVDHSGSMQGPKWEAADWAVKGFLARLTPQDAFAIGLFHDKTKWLGSGPRAAEAKAVAEAVEFLERNRDQGGTQLGVALEQALGQARGAGTLSRNVMIITDAEVTDDGRILRLAAEESRRADRRRISVLCIDAAPNALLASDLAERSGGQARFLTSEAEEEDISTALDEVLADWDAPVLAGLRLEVGAARVEAAGRDVSAEATSNSVDLGDLPAGRPVWVVGRVPNPARRDVAFSVTAAGGRAAVADLRLDPMREVSAFPALAALFGARRVLALEQLVGARYDAARLREGLVRLGYATIETAPSVYAENAEGATVAGLKKLLVQEALRYGIACSETAFVATREEAGRVVEGTVAVANGLPAGSRPADTVAFHVGGSVVPTGARMYSIASPSTGAAPTRGMNQAKAARARVRAGEPAPAPPKPANMPLFSAVPTFAGAEAVLFDSSRKEDAGRVPASGRLTRLVVRFPSGSPPPVDPGIALLLFVADLSSPRARVSLADLLRQGGERPLNLSWRPGDVVRLVLLDPSGAWRSSAPAIEVTLLW